jgi:hypothetical protein
MPTTLKPLKIAAIVAVLAVGVGPSCSTADMPLRPADQVYTTYEAPRGPGPGVGCNRNPPPSQC